MFHVYTDSLILRYARARGSLSCCLNESDERLLATDKN